MHDRVVFLTVGRGGGRRIPGAQVPKGKNKGGWRYGQGTHGDADLSATQFVLLALRAASQAGYPVEKVSRNVWRDAADYVKRCQRPDGGFAYQVGGGRTTGSMAACGVGSLIICKEQMLLAQQHDREAPSPPEWIDDAIKKGTNWLDENFVIDRNPGHAGHHYYYLYGIERIGDLAHRKEFGKLDWYTRGARMLVANQDAGGRWQDGTAFRPHRQDRDREASHAAAFAQ